jgi:hypothetical protein
MNPEILVGFHRFTPDRPARPEDRRDRKVVLHQGQGCFTSLQSVNLGPDFGQLIGKGKAGRGHLDPPLFHALSIAPIPENFAKRRQ